MLLAPSTLCLLPTGHRRWAVTDPTADCSHRPGGELCPSGMAATSRPHRHVLPLVPMPPCILHTSETVASSLSRSPGEVGEGGYNGEEGQGSSHGREQVGIWIGWDKKKGMGMGGRIWGADAQVDREREGWLIFLILMGLTYKGQAWCSGESCLTESPGRGFEAASLHLQEKACLGLSLSETPLMSDPPVLGLPPWVPLTDPIHCLLISDVQSLYRTRVRSIHCGCPYCISLLPIQTSKGNLHLANNISITKVTSDATAI
jgi:hypothetical protein